MFPVYHLHTTTGLCVHPAAVCLTPAIRGRGTQRGSVSSGGGAAADLFTERLGIAGILFQCGK